MSCCFTTVSTSDVGIIERFGKFNRLASPGLVFVCCPYETVAGTVSLRIQQLEIICETKTLDNVFVMVSCSVQFQVMKTRVYQSFYSLSHAEEQMRSYVFDSLRAALSTLTLDQAFDCKDDISVNLKATLNTVFSDYGFQICQTLVTDISPNNRVKDAMNEINSSMRIKEASYQRAEGEKLLKVKRAEAEAESMHLSGVGVARSRHAIMDGLKESIQAFSEGVTGTTARDVMDLLILTQYFDALQEVGSHGTTRTIFLAGDSNPIRSGILEANSAQ